MTVDALSWLILIGAGLFMAFGTRHWIARSQQRHARKLADRLARGSDAYFDELRSLQTYKPPSRIWLVRALGIALAAFSALNLYLDIKS
ncbi:hypothetical protein [Hephaestia mangrovi]|uniref:hypothetical protein n=1 Tax=Hephaestia mangrovi TaxID=2873268 RepID=UPI001CA745D6|nr:hypothetical protein [Hephaestia mangrovi]MBY8826815.1 hypothetical protein [Hephaestia mangrovi]